MIDGYIENNVFKYNTNLKTIDTKDIFLAIDGNVSKKYYGWIINNYKKYNLNFISKINDFISIYLYDKKTNRLIIINDRIGSKKVYYYYDKKNIYFSNSLKFLIEKYNINKVLNSSILSMYFRYHYIPEPFTIYCNVNKLRHGNYLIYENKKIDSICYWNIIELFNKRKLIKNYREAESGLNNLLESTIKKLINEKNKTCVYLSSGIDSSLVTSLYRKISNGRINTFSIGFELQKYNETKSSKLIANYLKTNHHELIINNIDALCMVKKVLYYYDEPFGDSSAVSTIILNEYAKQNNVKVALTGDGSDQLFCGMLGYDFFYKLDKLSKIVNPFRISLTDRLLRSNKLFYLFSNVPRNYRAQIDMFTYERKINGLFSDDGMKRYEYSKVQANSLQEERMIVDLDTFTAERVLPKMCIAAKKNDIEIIPPFLSHKIIEYSFNIPHKYKYFRKQKKYILKQILYKNVPKKYFNNKKRGFGIPVTEWLKGIINDDLKRVSDKEFLNKQNIFNYEKVQYLISNIDDNADLVWDYYMFQLWYEKEFM